MYLLDFVGPGRNVTGTEMAFNVATKIGILLCIIAVVVGVTVLVITNIKIKNKKKKK